MEQRNAGSNIPSEKPAPDTTLAATAEKQPITGPVVTQGKPASESRQAYGTAKTENLQDTGLWRILLPAFVIACCVALLAIPLIILIPLFFNSLNPSAAANIKHISLTWLWIVLIILDVSIAAVAIRGLLKIFMTQAGNYQS
jgi:hypothetical protein